MRNRFARLVLAHLLALTMAACGGGKDDGVRNEWYDGRNSFEERQSIQDYQNTVEAQLGRYVAELGASSGPVVVKVPSTVTRCLSGYEMTTAIVIISQPVDEKEASSLAKRLFAEVGLTTVTSEDKRGFSLHDEANGGFVSLALNGKKGIGIYATSGCRPSKDGSDFRDTRTVPQWETDLPQFKQPTPTPTDGTDPTSTTDTDGTDPAPPDADPTSADDAGSAI